MAQRKGKYTVVFDDPPSILTSAAVGSKKEGEGPMAKAFDVINDDAYFGQASWEKAESKMQETAIQTALGKAGLSPADIDCVFAGDLLNQCVGSTYGLRELGIPFVGLFGACSTMAESLCVSSVFLEAGAVRRAVACTSSHFCSAERQFRTPLEYGGQRAPTAQWTATASGAAVLHKGTDAPFVRAVTIGTIEDLGITDANNMGAAMAPAVVILGQYSGNQPAIRICSIYIAFIQSEQLSEVFKRRPLTLQHSALRKVVCSAVYMHDIGSVLHSLRFKGFAIFHPALQASMHDRCRCDRSILSDPEDNAIPAQSPATVASLLPHNPHKEPTPNANGLSVRFSK